MIVASPVRSQNKINVKHSETLYVNMHIELNYQVSFQLRMFLANCIIAMNKAQLISLNIYNIFLKCLIFYAIFFYQTCQGNILIRIKVIFNILSMQLDGIYLYEDF